MARELFVYILASWRRELYTGVTGNLQQRLLQHRSGSSLSYTRRLGIHRLVYYERLGPPRLAIAREKQIKSWSRAKRIGLIESVNPAWLDLSDLSPLNR
jgi:putative endonuclease